MGKMSQNGPTYICFLWNLLENGSWLPKTMHTLWKETNFKKQNRYHLRRPIYSEWRIYTSCGAVGSGYHLLKTEDGETDTGSGWYFLRAICKLLWRHWSIQYDIWFFTHLTKSPEDVVLLLFSLPNSMSRDHRWRGRWSTEPTIHHFFFRTNFTSDFIQSLNSANSSFA